MITRDEIEVKGQEFDIHTSNVQRDYVFGWLLAGIYSSPLRDSLILKGGNCLRKAYFQNTRFSSDLDFSVTSNMSEEFLNVELNRVCDFVQEHSGVTFYKERNKVEEKSNSDNERKIYEARLYFQDFYGNPHTITISIRLDVTLFDRIYLPVQRRFLIHPYSDADTCKVELVCHKLEELLAAKLKCLLQRRHSFDLYDYVYSIFINRDIEVNRSEILTAFLKKTIFERSPGVAKALLLELPFEFFKGVWNKYIVCPKQSLIDFETAISSFRSGIEALFERFQVDYYGRIAFFPAALRNIILDAGSNFNLLEIVYDHHRRIVEPYALTFKIRKSDGFGQEYFFAYDRTGGQSSGPGIKTFLHTKITDIKATNERFEPRFPVELSKAGEFGGRTYFGSPFPTVATTRRPIIRRRQTRRIYMVECSYCRKRFPRARYSTRLRRRKDKYGNQCYGRSGYIAY